MEDQELTIAAEMEQAVDHFVDYMNLTAVDWGCKHEREIAGVIDSLTTPECFDVALAKLFNNKQVERALKHDTPVNLEAVLRKYGDAYHQGTQRTEYSREIMEYESRVRGLVEFMMFDSEDFSDEESDVEMIAHDMQLSEFVEMALEKLQKLGFEF